MVMVVVPPRFHSGPLAKSAPCGVWQNTQTSSAAAAVDAALGPVVVLEELKSCFEFLMLLLVKLKAMAATACCAIKDARTKAAPRRNFLDFIYFSLAVNEKCVPNPYIHFLPLQ